MRFLDEHDGSLWVNWQQEILNSPAAAVAARVALLCVRPFDDPALLRCPARYGVFVQRLLLGGVATVGPWKPNTVGLFFVAKSGGKIRMIADTRFANCECKAPISTRLPTAAAYSHIELDGGPPLSLAQSDLADAFYHFRLPSALSEYFVLPEMRACDLPDSHELFTADPRIRASPRLQVLPMGWRWALRFSHRGIMAEAALRSDRALSESRRRSPTTACCTPSTWTTSRCSG